MWGNLWVPGPTQRPDGCTTRRWVVQPVISEVGRPADPYGMLDGFFVTVTEHCHTRSPSNREHYKEVSSPHMHTRWRQRRTLLDIQAQHIGAIIRTVCCAAPTYMYADGCQINGCVLDSGRPHISGSSSHHQHTTNRHHNNACAVRCRTVWQKWFQPHGVGQDMDHLHPSTAVTRCRALVPQQTQTFWRSSSGID